MARLVPKHLAGWKFCPMTDWVNPVVDRLRIWSRIETALQLVGINPTRERAKK